MRNLWYTDAIICCLDVETYVDANGDGIGDFAGLTTRLAYLAGLGIPCLWLLPFYPSPNRDNGFDVTDYYKMHLLFNFLVNQHLFLALVRKQAALLIKGLWQLPEIPDSAQWANFLRNHDELDLGRLSPA